MRAYGKSVYNHGFYNRVRVAFEYGSVHKGARISLVGVAYYELFVFLYYCGGSPFTTCREAAAASAS